eukprot:14144658-Ditylum_brightwellii.AAC.1
MQGRVAKRCAGKFLWELMCPWLDGSLPGVGQGFEGAQLNNKPGISMIGKEEGELIAGSPQARLECW